METPKIVECKVCNITSLHISQQQSHFQGKKHLSRQERYDKEHKTVFVSGTYSLKEEDLLKIFKKFGQIVKIDKVEHKNYSFIRFENESSVAAAIKARVFAGRIMLFVRKYVPDIEENLRNKRKMTDSPAPNLNGNKFGFQSLPIELQDPENCPEGWNQFDWQISQFIAQVEFTNESKVKLDNLVKDVQGILSHYLPNCQVLIFGSCGSTLAFKGSDVDLFVQCEEKPSEKFVDVGARALRSQKSKIQAIQKIPKARIPIVKFEHVRSGFQCDITAKSKLGFCNTRLIRFLLSCDDRLRPLMMVVKYWAKVCGITGFTASHCTFTCYSLVMLVIFYLQQCDPPIIPPIHILQELAEEKEFIQGWECSFCDDLNKIREEYPMERNPKNIKELLEGFFEFYLKFDFQNIICPLLGYPIPLSDFKDVDKMPKEMDAYKTNLKMKECEEFKINVTVKTQDPFELGLNITKNIYDSTFLRFKNALKYSLEIVKTTEEQYLLKALFTIEKDTIEPLGEFYAFNLNFHKKADKVEEFPKWHALQLEALMLVLECVLKFKIEKIDHKPASKIQKLETSGDVHTSPSYQTDTNKFIYSCTGDHDLWSLRVQIEKDIKKKYADRLTTTFEQEFLVSDFLYTNPKSIVPSFFLQIEATSIETFNKRVRISLKNKIDQKKNPAWKMAANYLIYSLKNLVVFAEEYMVLNNCSDFESAKQSLIDLLQSNGEPAQAIVDPIISPKKLLNGCSASNQGEQENHTDPDKIPHDHELPNGCPPLKQGEKNNNTETDKILHNQKLLLMSLNIDHDTHRPSHTTENSPPMKRQNDNTSNDKPIVNTTINEMERKELQETAENHVKPDEIQTLTDNNVSIPMPPRELLLVEIENHGKTDLSEPSTPATTASVDNQGFNTGRGYRSHPDDPINQRYPLHRSCEERRAQDCRRTPIEKQKQWYPSLK